MMLAISLWYIAFIMLRYIPSIPSFIRAFIVKGCLIFSKAFSASIEMSMWVLSLLLLICCITFNELSMLNHSCILRMKLTWSWCMISLICCWIRLANILLRIFASTFIKEIGLWFSFFVVSLFGCGISIILAS
jgi:hypothetical protein